MRANFCSVSARQRQRAVALVMVLCALFLLSMVIFGLAQRVREDLFVAGRDNRALDARALAFTGLEIALHPLSSARTPAMRRNVDGTHRYEARLLGEGGKFNLNWLLTGEDPLKLQMFKSFLENRGFNFQEREEFVDCLLDWIEPGSTHHLNGSKTGLDGLPVPGRPFQDLAEIRRVKGSGPLTHVAGWERDFTLLSKGPIDLQWASEEIIASLPGVGEVRARGFVQKRRGEDQIDGTADDLVFNRSNGPAGTGVPGVPAAGVSGIQQAPPNTELIAQLLGLSPVAYQAISELIAAAGDSTVRIVSAGQAFDTVRTVEVIARKEGLQPLILSWKEY